MWSSAASALTAVVDACAAQPACRAAYPSVRADFVRLVTELTDHPRSVSVPDPAPGTVVIDGSKVVAVLVRATMSPGGIAEIPRILDDLAHGSGTLAAAVLLDGGPPPGFVGWGLTYGVFCSELAGPPAELLAGGRAVFPELPEPVLSLVPQSPFTFADCARWPVPAAHDAVRAPVSSDVPVLVMAGAFDAATAPANGDLVAATLPRAVRVTFPDAGHDVTNHSPKCAVDVIHGFVDRTEAPDLSCVANLTPPTFTVGPP
jgi:pimeloyl-ACP methyl ester carboxylesterase